MTKYRSTHNYYAALLGQNPAEFKKDLAEFFETVGQQYKIIISSPFGGGGATQLVPRQGQGSMFLHSGYMFVWNDSGPLTLLAPDDFNEVFVPAEDPILTPITGIVCGTSKGTGEFALNIEGAQWNFGDEAMKDESFWIGLRDALVARFPFPEENTDVTVPRGLLEDVRQALTRLSDNAVPEEKAVAMSGEEQR